MLTCLIWFCINNKYDYKVIADVERYFPRWYHNCSNRRNFLLKANTAVGLSRFLPRGIYIVHVYTYRKCAHVPHREHRSHHTWPISLSVLSSPLSSFQLHATRDFVLKDTLSWRKTFLFAIFPSFHFTKTEIFNHPSLFINSRSNHVIYIVLSFSSLKHNLHIYLKMI